MTQPGPKRNIAASVHRRLLELSRHRNENFSFVLTRYGMERFLYRLSQSPHASTFVLKGAILFTVWSGHPHRTTKDIDLLGSGEPRLDRLESIFRAVCAVAVEEDAIVFDPKSVTAARIKEDAEYEGVRVHFKGKLGSALLDMQVDIGFGDAVIPAPTTICGSSRVLSSSMVTRSQRPSQRRSLAAEHRYPSTIRSRSPRPSPMIRKSSSSGARFSKDRTWEIRRSR